MHGFDSRSCHFGPHFHPRHDSDHAPGFFHPHGDRECAGGRGRSCGPNHPGGPFGFGPPGGAGFPWSFFGRGGSRARRGDVRAGILVLLSEQPRNGYQLKQELEQRSHGMWRPSPGSIYPTLQQLEDEGLVVAENKLYTLTDAGRKYVKDHEEDLRAPWEEMADAAGDEVIQLMKLVRQAGAAAMQVMHSGNAAQIAEAKKILSEARRSLYRLLAEDDAEDED